MPQRSPSGEPLLAVAIALGLVIAGPGCQQTTATTEDAGDGEAAPGDADVREDAEGGADGGDAREDAAGPDPGPITLVSEVISVATERICDVDGDGAGDNVLADLGNPTAGLIAGMIDSRIQSHIEQGRRWVVHLPWVDDRSIPHDETVVGIFFRAGDTDVPPDPSDDFSGSEPFYVRGRFLDACGEPLYGMTDCRLDAGSLTTPLTTVPFDLDGILSVTVRALRASIAPFGREGDVHMCGYATIPQLGDSTGLDIGDGQSALELFLAGGAAIGVPVPGADPDVDLDGDGLERFTLNEEGFIESCIDGDGQPLAVSGRDCWREPQMADAFSLTFTLRCTSAELAGREPDWEASAQGECPEGPPEESLFDPR